MKSRAIISTVIFILALSFSHVLAEVPQMISYQSKLTTPSGALIDTTIQMEFAIYDDSTGGSVLWTETQPSVVVEYGIYSVLLGSMNPIPDTVFNGDVRYLGVKVGTDPEMTPRKTITSVAYAYRAATSSSTFIRWGNGTAPAGSELIYSGFAYAEHHNHSVSNNPIVIQTGDPGINPGHIQFNLLHPLAVDNNPPGITSDCYIKAAVCYTDGPSVIVWGTHTPPTGWKVLYRGYSLGAHYNQSGIAGPICVESEYFDDSVPIAINYTYIYGTLIRGYATGDEDLQDKFVKCVVCKKE